jgi:hypothetical protein
MTKKIPLQPGDFTNLARETVQQRGTDNGYDAGQERSAAKIAKVFNAITGHNLSEADAWTFLIVLKLVRNQRKFKVDNIVDMIGYAALLGECLDADDEMVTDLHIAAFGIKTAEEQNIMMGPAHSGATGSLLDEIASIPARPLRFTDPSCEHNAWEIVVPGVRRCVDCGALLPPCSHGTVLNGICKGCGATLTTQPQ